MDDQPETAGVGDSGGPRAAALVLQTVVAERRLSLALGQMYRLNDHETLPAFAGQLRLMSQSAPRDTMPGVAGVYDALADLADVVYVSKSIEEGP